MRFQNGKLKKTSFGLVSSLSSRSMTQQNFALVNEILSTARFFGNPLLLRKYKRKIQPVLLFSPHDLGFLSLGKERLSVVKKIHFETEYGLVGNCRRGGA